MYVIMVETKSGVQVTAPASSENPSPDGPTTSQENSFNSRRTNKKKRAIFNNSNRFKGDEDKLDGHVFQCDGELGKKVNQFQKTLNQIKLHVAKNVESPCLFEGMLTEHKDKTLTEPQEPADNASRVEIFKWELKMTKFFEEEQALTDGKFVTWALIWGQMSELVRTKIKANSDFEAKQASKDVVWLIKPMKNVETNVQDIKHPILTIVEARKKLYSHRQRYDQNLLDFA